MFCCIDMARGAFVIVLGHNIGDGSKVRLTTEPVERADISLKEIVQGLAFVDGKVHVRN